MHVCLKLQLCLKMLFPTPFDLTLYAEQSQIQKIFFFLIP